MRLAFAELDGIHVINGDGSGGRRISHYEGDHACYDLEPSWSPDGTGIAFAVRCEDGDLGIYLISPDGTERIRLTGMEGGTDTYASYFDAYPVWSPDGTRIAFTRVTGGPDYRYDLDVMNAEGTDVIRLIEGRLAPLAGITWSPDSSRIAFGDGQTGQVWLVGADGSDPRAVTDPTSSACCPAWRPE